MFSCDRPSSWQLISDATCIIGCGSPSFSLSLGVLCLLAWWCWLSPNTNMLFNLYGFNLTSSRPPKTDILFRSINCLSQNFPKNLHSFGNGFLASYYLDFFEWMNEYEGKKYLFLSACVALMLSFLHASLHTRALCSEIRQLWQSACSVLFFKKRANKT